jgi:superoxide reductase
MSVVGLGAALVLPRRLLASSVHVGGPLAGSVYYTRESPGLWRSMVAEHLPRLKVAQGPGGTAVVTVTTQHEMDGYRHCLVKS